MDVRRAVRWAAVALIAAVTSIGTTQAADAAPKDPLTDDLVMLWKAVLQTPRDQNPFNGASGTTCWDLGDDVVAPFGPSGVPSCTVTSGTRIFVVGASNECSTFEQPAGTDLASCAREGTADVRSVTVDGRPVPLTYVESSVEPIELPANNLFSDAPARGHFVAAGWVTLLDPLPVGTHTIVSPLFSTTIIVQCAEPASAEET
jgi:hypothetical protein